MKIKIQTENGEIERNWYIQDLDCYTPEFLQQIILSLYYEGNNHSQDGSICEDKAELQPVNNLDKTNIQHLDTHSTKQEDLSCEQHRGNWHVKCDKCYKNYFDYMESQRLDKPNSTKQQTKSEILKDYE